MTNVISFESFRTLLAYSLSAMHRPRSVVVACLLGAFCVVLQVVQLIRHRLKTTALSGPPNPSFLWGVGKMLLMSPDSGAEYERWAQEYGWVYEIPSTLGGRRIVLCDPKAIAHFYGRDTWTYVLTPFEKIATENIVGKGMLSAMGESHRRMRKTLSPAFSNAAVRNLTSVFYDSAYKVKDVWDSFIESSSGGAVIDIQKWLDHACLDTIGIAGFSHDFGSLDGKRTSVTEIFEIFGRGGKNLDHMFLILLAQALPWLMRLPTPHLKIIKRLNDTIGGISNTLLVKLKKEKDAGILGEREEKSILGVLIQTDGQNGGLHLTQEEVTGQATFLLLAGYETVLRLQWALIELSRNPHVQTKLRAELLEFGADPTFDQLSSNLPYLDAVVHETLRMHVPLQQSLRMASAAADDVIPLSKPVRTRSGTLVDHISVAKGTELFVPISCMNRSTFFWGPDAKEFKPERWIGEDGIPEMVNEIQGHRHLLSFIDGPRSCLGKSFALAEFKIMLSVLVKNFAFELPGGPETMFEMANAIVPRPKVAGEEGTAVPLRVRRSE